ncbi:LysR family transcriptional regulator [Pseudoalteromonas sp. SSDWG2]|uniref:LysR family transcriptional regulator n=1 Tax=Pseudoalteromonas sp. SSDWG2 TaxID=3139391 RepID=UPI003BAA39AF
MQTPIRGLRAFCFAARCLSFKQAAEQLYLTPSAVSHQIKQLEEQLGFALFQRRTRAIILTNEGKNFFDAIEPIITDLEQTIRTFSHKDNNVTISIALPEFFASELLMPKLGQWTAANPDVNLEVDTLRTRTQKVRSTDLSIVLSHDVPASGIATELFALEYIPACNRALHQQWQNAPYEALQEVPLIVHQSRPWSWHQWAEYHYEGDFAPKQIIQLDSMFAVARAAQQGMGIALIPMPISRSWFNEGMLWPLVNKPLWTKDKYFLVEHEVSEKNSPLASFTNWVVETFKG